MKTKNLILSFFVVFALLMQSCQQDPEPIVSSDSILPSNFSVDIPKSISSDNTKHLKNTKADSLSGRDVYMNLSLFIHVGESAAQITEDIIKAIRVHQINRPMSLSYEGDDHRTKNLTVIENSPFNGVTWTYQLTITDAQSEGNEDGGNAMQVFWNPSPIQGIALLKPYNIDRTNSADAGNATYRIEYSEAGEHGYDASMIVSIAGIELSDPQVDPYSINALKMFVGKKGDIVDVYGNSNHPNAKFFTDDTGFSWAFVASGNESSDIAVAEVGLPPHTLDETNRTVLLEDYSIKNVFTEQITEWFLDTYGIAPDQESLSMYLQNADAPGFFDTDGFIQGGTSPGDEYTDLLSNIQILAPYNPKSVNDMVIVFK
jgi:hypothetical protein